MSKKLFLLFLCLWVGGVVVAQSATFTKITNPGSIYSTPRISESVSYMLKLKEQLSQTVLEEVYVYAEESGWPEGIQTLEKRNAVREKMKDYNTYYCADLPDDKILLWVPTRENAQMSAGMRGDHHFYIVISRNAVNIGTKQTPIVDGSKLDQLLSFDTPPAASNAPKYTQITNAGKLYSGIDEKKSENIAALQNQLSESIVQDVMKYAQDDNWPAAMSDFFGRVKLEEEMKKYKAYYIADLPSNKVVLWIPSAENESMPYGMKMGRDFYIVMGKEGVNLGAKTTPSGAGIVEFKPQNAFALNTNSFEAQINTILTDYPNKFANIKGQERPKQEFQLGLPNLDSKVKLEGTEDSYIAPAFMGGKPSFIATYGNYKTKAAADAKLAEIVAKLDAAKFPCSFVKNDFIEYDNLSNQSYLPFDMNNKMGPAFEDIVLEVEIIKSFDFDKTTFKMNDVWMVTLRVKQNK